MAVTGMHLGGAIARALGLPPETTDILINIGLHEPISILCRYYPSEEAMRAVMAELAQYRLEVVDEAPSTDTFTQDQRRRLFRQSLLRGECGVESPYLQRYRQRKTELTDWESLVASIPASVDATLTQVIYARMRILHEQIARMEAGEAV